MKLMDETMESVGETAAPFVAIMFIVLHMFMILVSCLVSCELGVEADSTCRTHVLAAWRSGCRPT